MSTVSAPPPQPPQSPPQGTAAQAVATVREAPQALLDVPQGTQMAMRVLAAVRGAMEVASDYGPLTVKTPLPPLPPDTLLTLAMTGGGNGQATLRVIAIDGKPLAQALADIFATRGGGAQPQPGQPAPLLDAAGRPLPMVPAGTAALGPAPGQVPGQVLGQGQAAPQGLGTPAPVAAPTDAVELSQGLLRATVLTGDRRLNPDILPGTPRPQPLAPGTTLDLRLLSIQGRPLQPSPAGAATAAPPATPLAASPAAATPHPAAPSAPPPPGPPPQLSPGPGPAPMPPSPGPMPAPGGAAAGPLMPSPPPATGGGAILPGVVASNAANGATLLRTEIGMLALHGRTSLQPGTAVTVQVMTQQPPPPSPAGAQPAPPPVLTAGPAQGVSAWPALGDALDLLSRTDPQAAQALGRALPAPDGRMVANAIAFLQASQSGDIRQFTGERVLRALERAGPKGRDLLDRLGDDMRDLATRGRDGGGGEWRTHAVPFAAGGEIDRIAIVTRRDGGGEGDGTGDGRDSGTRFLIDLDLTRLGAMQLDGLYRGRQRAFDLILRTRTPLPAEMRRDLLALWTETAEALGLAGTLGFQTVERFVGPRDLPPDAAPDDHTGGVVV